MFWLLLVLVFFFLFLFLSLALSSVAQRFLRGRGLFSRVGTGLKHFMPPFQGRAHIVDPVKTTKDAESDLFAQALQHAAAYEVRQRWSRVRSGLQAGPITMLTVPSVLASAAIQGLPEVKGVNLGKIFQFLFILARYFSWRVESRVAFCPAVKAENGHPAALPRLRVSASIRWAWFVKETVEVEREVRDQYDVDSVAFAVAARIEGIQFDRT